MTRYYIEHDGRVRTIQREGLHDLPGPDELGELPFEESVRRTVLDRTVVFGQAELDHHPTDWPRKDDLARSPDVSLLVRASIDTSHFRPVVGVVVRHRDRVLLVQPARGVAEGHWTLPGGFVNAFEDPVDGARREVREETGLEVEDLALAGTVTYAHQGAPYPILGLAFTAHTPDDKLSLRQEEIAQARWFQVADATERSRGFAGRVLQRLGQEGLL